MSIADTITSIETHLTSDYEGISNLGIDLTNINKNIQNIRTCLDTIYQEYPKTEYSEGTLATISGSKKGKLEIIEEGNSTQHTTTGKQLFNKNANFDYSNVPSNTWTISALDTGIRVKTTYTAGTPTIIFVLKDLTDYVGKVVRIKGKFTINGNRSARYLLGLCNSDGSNRTPKTNTIPTSEETLSFSVGTLSGEQKYLYCGLYCSSEIGATANDYIDYTNLIVTIDNSDMSYEDFTGGTASPNPSYPQNIKSVTGNNNVVVRTANLVNYGGTQVNLAQNGTRATNITPTNFPLTLQAGTYTLNYDDLVTTNTTNGLYTTLVSTTGNIDIPKTSSGKTTTFTLAEEKTINKIYVYVANADTGATATFSKIMLNSGSTALDYQPYTSQTLPLNLGSIELNKIGDYQDYIYKTSGKNYQNVTISSGTIISGLTYTINPDKTITLNGTNNSGGPLYLRIAENFTLPAGTYTLSNGISIPNCYYYDDNHNFDTAYTDTKTFTSEVTIKPYIRINNGASISNQTIKPMINTGSTALPYEPYGSGNWYKKEQVGKVIFTGAVGENWTFYSSAHQVVNSNITDYLSFNNGGKCYCNYYIGNALENVINQNNHIWIGNSNFISIQDEEITSAESFKTWLSTHNTIVKYILATPQDIQITDTNLISQLEAIDNAQSYNGTTIITSTYDSANAQMILKARALKGE